MVPILPVSHGEKMLSLRREDLQTLWKSGKSLKLEMDRVGVWVVDSTQEYIRARMVFRHILTDQHWEVETWMRAPLFEPFGFGESDGSDEFRCREVTPVDWSDISYEEVKTLSQEPPRLPRRTLV